jgi:hypothetical protein
MGRLGVRHAVVLLREGKAPPEEVLTRVEMIDRSNIAAFVKRGAEAARPKDKP